MNHVVSIDESEKWAMLNGMLEALKASCVPSPDNQQQLGDGDLNKIMDPYLYEVTRTGDAEKFIRALKSVSKTRSLSLSLIFDQVTPSGNSLLHVAASSGAEDVLELILTHFPHLVTRKNSSEDTPLHVAVQDGKLNATRLLIRLRRDSEITYWKNKDNKSPLYLAAETGHLEILRLLLDASTRHEAYAVKIQGISPVLAALREGKSDILEQIIEQLPKLLHVQGENGGTPLHSAASVGNAWAVRFLLKKCTYLALQTDTNGSYPIHAACAGGDVLSIHELLNTWPDLAEIKNKKGQNILHVAARGGNNKGVKYILQKCSEPGIRKLVNSQDVDGNTPLHLAAIHIHCPVLLSLTKGQRTDVRLLNNDKLTALDVVMEPRRSSTEDQVLQARAILIHAGVPRGEGRDVQSPREQSSEESESSNAKWIWIKDRINIRLLVGTLVASVTFTAGFTLPGGYNASSDRHPGMATLLHNRVLQLFVISNTLAMYSSILAVVILLTGHVTDFHRAEEAYLKAGPLLFMAFTSMAVAFLAALVVAVSKLTWLAALVLCIAVLHLVMLLMYLRALIPHSPRLVCLQRIFNGDVIPKLVNMCRLLTEKLKQRMLACLSS